MRHRVQGLRAMSITTWATALWFAPGITLAQSAAPSADERARAMTEMRERQNATPDTPGTGAHAAIKESVATLPDHVVYRPADLGKLGARKLGIYVFGNGACSDDGASARLHRVWRAHWPPISRLDKSARQTERGVVDEGSWRATKTPCVGRGWRRNRRAGRDRFGLLPGAPGPRRRPG